MNARRFGLAVGFVTLLTSGAYVILYLVRWEWNRALIAGLLFVATEVALATMLLLARIGRLERSAEAPANERTLAHIQETSPPPKNRLRWLDQDGLSVFVPVLMGAGLIVSVVAMAVERIARVTARPVLERRLAQRLSTLLLAPASAAADVVAPRTEARSHPVLRALAVLALTVAVVAGIDWLADLTQTRPDGEVSGMTSVVVQVEANAHPRAPLQVADRLWEACRGTVPSRLTQLRVESVTQARVIIGLEPALGEHQETRLRGCLEDATLDNVRADVLDMEWLPLRGDG